MRLLIPHPDTRLVLLSDVVYDVTRCNQKWTTNYFDRQCGNNILIPKDTIIVVRLNVLRNFAKVSIRIKDNPKAPKEIRGVFFKTYLQDLEQFDVIKVV